MSAERTTLRTKRLVLRPVTMDDVADVLAYAADPEWSRYSHTAPQPYTRADAETWVASSILADWKTNPRFGVELEGRMIGEVELRIDAESGVGELGYSVARAQWGKGITPEAVRALIDYGFAVLGLDKVFARADVRNTASVRVMEKLGMTYEGTLRAHRIVRGERVDDVCYGLLPAEWSASAS